ncbi:MAG TPA: FadR/GntR family transcriptional regulator [Actinoplanes sp.]|jgi:DNA-binding FadR family transcriptional regulator
MALSDDAVEAIKNMILDGRLRPGDRLPVEKNLAATLGLSRGTLREAVRALTLIGVLDTRQGDGTYVTSLEPHVLMASLSFAVDLHQGNGALLLLETRRVLESYATGQAATLLGSADLARLDELLTEADRLVQDDPVDHDALLANDQEFHRTIVRATGNAVMASLIESLSGQTMRARLWRELADEGAARRTVAEHRAIAEALVAGDPERARLRAAVHVAGVEDFVRSQIAARPGAGIPEPADVRGPSGSHG